MNREVNTLGVLKPEVKARALRLWLSGLTYRAVSEETGVSLGAMNELVNEARKKAPDVDDLRQLNVALQKSGVALADAVRACSVISQLHELGVGINELSEYVESSKKLAAAQDVGATELIESALKLFNLEKETGKPYHEVVREFEDKQARVKELDSQRVKIQEELSRAKEKLSKTVEELKHAVGTKERLQRLGIEKTATLAKFVEDYELLSFSVKEVQQIAELKKELDAEGIHIGTLRQHFKSTRVLKQKREALQKEIESWEAKLKVFSRMEREIRDIQRVQYLINVKKAFACGYCGSQILHDLRRFEVNQCLAMGQPIILKCQMCGRLNTYNPYEVLTRLGFELLS